MLSQQRSTYENCTLARNKFLHEYSTKFIARWWPVCKIRSDQRTNIVGTQTELKKALEEIDHDDIPRCPSKDFTEWVIKWKNNLPDATHMGGVWEYWWRNQRSWCCPRAPSRRPLFISVEQQIVLFCYLKPCVFPTPKLGYFSMKGNLFQ